MKIIGSVYEKDCVYVRDARWKEGWIIRMPAAGDVAKSLHMFVYRGEPLPVLCTKSVTNHAINCPVNIHVAFYTAFSLFFILFVLLLFFCQTLTIYTTRSPLSLSLHSLLVHFQLSPFHHELTSNVLCRQFFFFTDQTGFLSPSRVSLARSEFYSSEQSFSPPFTA
jgi:hypothetical protein